MRFRCSTGPSSGATPSIIWASVFRNRPLAVLDAAAGPLRPRWLPGAKLNIAESCLAAYADAGGHRVGRRRRQSDHDDLRRALRRRWAQVAAALAAAGFHPGDALAIDMPMTPASVVIYLGLVWAGMRVVSIADSLAAAEVATRLRIANAVGLFTAFSHRPRRQAAAAVRKAAVRTAPAHHRAGRWRGGDAGTRGASARG